MKIKKNCCSKLKLDKAKQQLNAMPDHWYNRIEMATNSFPVLPLWSEVYSLAPEPRSALWIALTIDCSRRKTVSSPRQGFWLEFVSSSSAFAFGSQLLYFKKFRLHSQVIDDHMVKGPMRWEVILAIPVSVNYHLNAAMSELS